jgi:hypothetical protein
MKTTTKIAAAAILGLVSTAAIAPAASAAVVCNGEGECWHTHQAYTYAPEYGVVVHPDSWRWGADEHYRWHEHGGRGYWRNGVWIRF